MKGFEVIGETEKGIEIEDKRSIFRRSHNALVDSLLWIKGPLFFLIKNQPLGMDMFWVSSPLGSELDRIIPMLRGDELDVKLLKFDKRLLHVGPIFVSLYWVTSEFRELREGKMITDLPLFGATVRYRPDLPKKEVMNAYQAVRSFIEQNLKEKGFRGTCFWGFLEEEVISPNMFYFARTRRIVHGKNLYDGKELDHSFYFELGDEMAAHTKPKYVDFFVSPKGDVRYYLEKMRLMFEVFGENANVVESIEIPFQKFMLSIRPNAFTFSLECFEDATL